MFSLKSIDTFYEVWVSAILLAQKLVSVIEIVEQHVA